jgi:hypothetical protein
LADNRAQTFYAGTTSIDVDTYAPYMSAKLADWSSLSEPEWDPGEDGRGGRLFEGFLQDKSCYQNRPRLTRTINAARGLFKIKKHFPERRLMEHFLHISTYDASVEALQRVYKQLRGHLTMSEVATYHLMMELGFPIIKPDRVVNRVAIRLGLIEWQDKMGSQSLLGLPPASWTHLARFQNSHGSSSGLSGKSLSQRG